MRFDPVNTAVLDAVVTAYLDSHPDLPEAYILQQDLFTALSRRALLSTLNIQSGWTILDAGCGFGVVPLDLAGNLTVEAHGIDSDPAKLAVARELADLLIEQEHPMAGSSISFEEGEVARTPYADATFDFVLCSFVFQHLTDPEGATDELHRITKPGGLVCLIDADDGLSLVFPEPSGSFAALNAAFDQLQVSRGGDRHVGRKLASYLDGSGFAVISTLLMPAAEYRASQPGDPGRKFLLDRFVEERESIIAGGIMGDDEFDAHMKTLESEVSLVQFRTNSQLIAVGRRSG